MDGHTFIAPCHATNPRPRGAGQVVGGKRQRGRLPVVLLYTEEGERPQGAQTRRWQQELPNIHIINRVGSPTSRYTYDRISAGYAETVVLLADEAGGRDTDARTALSLLALKPVLVQARARAAWSTPPHVVVQMSVPSSDAVFQQLGLKVRNGQGEGTGQQRGLEVCNGQGEGTVRGDNGPG